MLIRPHDAPIAPGRGHGLPVVVPTHIHFDGDRTIRLHLAKPNPVWPRLTENPRCLFVVTAPYTYVPTSWEAPPGTEPQWGIPTSHYATVQLTCTAAITDDTDTIRHYLADQLATMQPGEPSGNPLDPHVPYTTELRQIRGLELHIDDIRAKFKFDGAEPDQVRRQVIDGYEARNAPGDAEALQHLLRRHPPETR